MVSPFHLGSGTIRANRPPRQEAVPHREKQVSPEPRHGGRPRAMLSCQLLWLVPAPRSLAQAEKPRHRCSGAFQTGKRGWGAWGVPRPPPQPPAPLLVPPAVRPERRLDDLDHVAGPIATACRRHDDRHRGRRLSAAAADGKIGFGSATATWRLMPATARQKRNSYRNFACRWGPKTGHSPVELDPPRPCPGRRHRVKHSAMSGSGESYQRRPSGRGECSDRPVCPRLPTSCCIATNRRRRPRVDVLPPHFLRCRSGR